MKWALALLVIVVLALHHDFWNWTNKSLVFGFLPIGLVYHACYAVLAALTMAILVRYAWPTHLEAIETHAEKVEEPA
jgi:hypothetical protein